MLWSPFDVIRGRAVRVLLALRTKDHVLNETELLPRRPVAFAVATNTKRPTVSPGAPHGALDSVRSSMPNVLIPKMPLRVSVHKRVVTPQGVQRRPVYT